MANTDAQDRLLNATSKDFATLLLPLYSGPQVTIRIGSASHEYKLPKALLCKQSTYFTAMFEGPFKQGEEQSATLEEEDDVVTLRSFQMLVQWVCLGRVIFEKCTPDVSITMAIEFARLADMCYVTGMESVIAKHIKAIILANVGPKDWRWEKGRAPDTNTRCLTSQHITSAVALPEGHPVRVILASAAVEGYLRTHNYQFTHEARKVPGFSADLLEAVHITLDSVAVGSNGTTFEDLISRERLTLKKTEAEED